MRTSTKLLLLLLIAGLAPQAFAQAPGSCRTGTAISFLSVNDVSASLFNTGGLFYGGSTTSGDGYLVPKAARTQSPIFASGIWVGGIVNEERRVAAARYGSYNFWPGPLDENTGRPVNPNDCSQYDRLYNVTRQDIANYEAGLAPARDLADWPVDLGAPVIDGDGDPTNYNLGGGDRPDIIGDQGIWWVMNDVGNEHPAGGSTAPIGIEIQALAWAFSRADALGQTTFYRYRIINKGPAPVENTYISIFSDPDLGGAGDDYVGIDTTLSLGYVYNSDDEDSAYGVPPAAGYDFFQGPIVDGDTLGTTTFTTFINGGPAGTLDPQTAEQYYNYMQGLWGDGTPITAFEQGYQTNGPVTKFVYPGDPVTGQFWSEVNNDNEGGASTFGDRRLVVSTGPFTLERNDPQDIVFGVVFAQGSDWLNSISALRAADVLAQTAYDVNFQLPPPAPRPPLCDSNSPNAQLRPGSGNCLEAVELDGKATLVWGYPTSSSNYLGQFEVEDTLLEGQDVDDSTYNFEGFNIYRYPTSSFAADQRQLVATFDKANGVTTVIDQVGDADTGGLVPKVVARGTDSGLQYSYDLPGLTNNTDYYYGITAYTYNAESTPKVIESAAREITVRPSRLTRGDLAQSAFGEALEVTVATQRGQGEVSARVIDPTRVTGADYSVKFFTSTDDEDHTFTNYSITNLTSGEVVFDGADYFARTGSPHPQGQDIVVVEGVSFSVAGPEAAIDTRYLGDPSWIEVANPNAVICANSAGGCDLFNNLGDPVYHSLNADSQYYFSEQGTGSEPNIRLYAPNDFEIRFTEEGSLGFYTFQDGNIINVPFEVWDIGPTGTGANDPSDDVQLIPILFADGGGTCEFNYGEIAEEATFGYPATDRIYAYYPATSHADYIAQFQPLVDAAPNNCYTDANFEADDYYTGTRPIQRQVFADFAQDGTLPETGTVVRALTTKPNLPGDEFIVSTDDREVLEGGIETPEEALDRIAIVPNPYMASSSYESGNLSRVVRFTNLPPEAATIQIYTVSGTLVKTLSKEGPSRSLDWDLTTQNNLAVASGMYLIRVNIDGVGDRVLKFGVVNRQTQITLF